MATATAVLTLSKTKATKRKAPMATTTTATKKPKEETKSDIAATSSSGAAKKKPRGRPQANNGFGSGKKGMENVHKLLSDLGVERPKNVSNCLKAGILNGSITLKRPEDDPEGKYDLDQVLVTGDCLCCDETDMTCRIRDVLYQPDYGGGDYEDGGEEAPFKCTGDGCGLGIYVTSMCSGSPSFDCGKFHNHCQDCPVFGVCIGDYREVHCGGCGQHYHAVGMGGACYNCKGKARGKKKAGGRGRQYGWVHVSDL